MYLNGLGFREARENYSEFIIRQLFINWVRESGSELPLDIEKDSPILAELDELRSLYR